jgi:hypothetical protein
LRVSIRQQQDHASPPYQPCRPLWSSPASLAGCAAHRGIVH